MAVTVNVNSMSVVHAASNGITTIFPDVCKTPSPGEPFHPLPEYRTLFRYGGWRFHGELRWQSGVCKRFQFQDQHRRWGRHPAGGGVVSNKTKGKAEFVNFSFDVKIEGKNVPRAMDLMLHNDKNTPPSPVVQGPGMAMPSSRIRPLLVLRR